MVPVPHDVGPRVKRPAVHPDLTKAADACRVLGVLFVLLGGVPLLQVSWRALSATWIAQALAVATTVVLVGPGVWYFIAARLIRRADRRAVRISLVVVVLQGVLVFVGMIAGQILGGQLWRLSVPSLLALFFLPALGATAYHLVRARRAADATFEGSAFDVLAPRPVLPLSKDDPETPPERLRPYE